MGLKKVYIVPYSHIDWGWGYYLGPSILYMSRVNSEIVARAVEILEREEDYRWCGVDKVYTLFGFWTLHPELREKFRTHVRSGRIDIACGMVSTPHLLGIAGTHCSGESLIRNMIYGAELMEEMLGFKFRNTVLQLNDVTGFFSQLPQIALKCGFKYLKVDRPGELYNRRGVPLNFWWMAPDGSTILCNRCPYGSTWKPQLYTSFEEAAEEFADWLDRVSRFSKLDEVLLYQGGDWDPPDAGLPEFVKEWNGRGLKPRLRISTPTEYFDAVVEHAGNLPVVRGSLDNVGWAALYGVDGDGVRREQREVIDLLLTCEKFLTIASLMGLKYPLELLKRLWIISILWEDHNTIVYLYPEDLEAYKRDLEYVKSKAKLLLDSALTLIASNIDVSGRGVPIVVFNQLSWKRRSPITARVRFSPFNGCRFLKVVDSTGREVPFQVIDLGYYQDGSISEAEVLFIADIPPLGYNTYYAIPVEEEVEFETGLRCFERVEAGRTVLVLENEYFRIEVVNGHLVSVSDKKAGREVLKISKWERLKGVGKFLGNCILCEKVEYGSQGLTGEVRGLEYSSSTFSPERVELVEKGPIRATVAAYFTYLEDPITLKIALYEGVPRVEFATVIHAKRVGRRFRVVFPLNVEGGRVFVDKPFSVEEVDPLKEDYECIERSYGKMGRVFGAYSWACLSDSHYSVALVSRQNSGFMLEEGCRLSSILLATIGSSRLQRFMRAPKMAGTGLHVLEYALMPSVGDVYASRIYQRAREYLNPPIVLAEVGGGGDLPQLKSFLEIGPENIVLTALYREGDQVVLHLFELEGRTSTARIKFFRNLGEVYEANFKGEKVGDDPFLFKEHQIKEVRATPASSDE